MRRLVQADIRRILKKKSVILLFLFALLFLCYHVFGAFILVDRDPYLAVDKLMSRLVLPEILLGLVILFGVYGDDFRSMSYVCVIGRGMTRSRLVLAKLLDTLILAVIMYGIIAAVLTFGLKAMGCTLTGILRTAYYSTFLITVYKAVGYIALSSMILYITNNIPLGTITLLLLYIVVPFSATIFGLNDQVRGLHIERIHYAGLAGNAFSDFMFGSIGAGILKLVIGLLVYMGLVITVTILTFNKKELNF